ncbi:MAG: hemerythrin domain-containing protein [Chloroflexota bacterium]
MAGTDIYQLLQKDHREVEQMFSQILGGGAQGLGVGAQGQQGGMQVFQTLAQELRAHMEAEDKTFYTELEKNPQGKDLVSEARKEHQQGQQLMQKAQGMGAGGTEWRSMIQDLQGAIMHHVQEEEGRVFSTARQALSQEQAEMIGERFQSQKQQMLR